MGIIGRGKNRKRKKYVATEVYSYIYILDAQSFDVEMNLGYKHDIISYCTLFLLVLVQQTHQYLYSCDPTVSCGCSPNSATVSRIVGGETAATSTWSWAVSISINNQALCGGSVISSSWVITAAHCVSGLAASKVTVYAGSNARFSGQSRVASSITVHPSYVSSSHVNDIALILLSSPLTISNSSVKPVCIPSVDSATLSAGEWPAAGLSVRDSLLYFDFQMSLFVDRLSQLDGVH